MPDYIEIKDAGGTKRKVSVDEIEGIFFQRVKLMYGGNDAAVDVGEASPLPVKGSGGVLVTSLEPRTSGGLTTGKIISAATTNATALKASAGVVYGWSIYNAGAAACSVKFFNKATAPELGVGKDAPKTTLVIPPGGTASSDLANGIAFSAGIGVAITKGLADANAEAVAAEQVVLNLFYK